MKKPLILLCCSLIIAAYSKAQDATDDKPHSIELGVDATSLLRNAFFFEGGYQLSPYFLTFRKHFTRTNIRAALGGNYSNRDLADIIPDDPRNYMDLSYNINARVGYEWFNELSKHWQEFYGVDFRPSYYYSKRLGPDYSWSYANGSESNIYQYGLAPVLGFRFHITDRLSLLTEASLTFILQKEEQRRYFVPASDLDPEIPDQKTHSTSVFTSFSQPLALFLTVDL